MNVLVTSAGRRTTLVKAFRTAVNKRNGKLLAGDIDSLAPSLYMVDKALKLPKATSHDYIERLIEYVDLYDIRLIVPTIDTELSVLAQSIDVFKKINCKLLISDLNLIDIANDKWKTVEVFKNKNVKVPRSWKPDNLVGIPEELFVKPRNGSASQHTYHIKKEDLKNLLPIIPNPIIQEYINCPEITIDALLDFSGKIIHYVPRYRIRTIGGESIQGVTIPDEDIKEWIINVLNIISGLGGRGPVTIQIFKTPDGPILSEINPRFGGGVPLTFAAGGDYPEWILQMVEGNKIEPKIGEYKKNLFMTRYYQEIILETPLWEVSTP